MSRSPDPGRQRRGLAALLVLAVAACAPTRSPIPASPAASPQNGPSPTPAPTPAIACTGEAAAVLPALRGDPCPGAIGAVEVAVSPVGNPMARLVIEPGPFYCDVIWPGVESAPACFGISVIPGQYMHAWVAFDGSDEVAAVMLGRDLPADLNVPAASPIEWHATLVKVEVPPAGWNMP